MFPEQSVLALCAVKRMASQQAAVWWHEGLILEGLAGLPVH